MAPLSAFTAIHVQSGLHRVTLRFRQHAASIQKIKIDFSKVPDWTRRATRLSIAVVFFGILGHCVQFAPEYQAFGSNFRQSCNWAAITCIVVTAPLIGKVAQVAFDRLLGTAVGGFIGCVSFTLGFHLFGAVGGGVFISLVYGIVVWTTTYVAYKRSLDQLVRFVQLTYIIVAFGAKPDKGAFLLALLRVGGIFAGGLLSVLLAVVVLPRSASIDCLLEMKKALKALYDLNQEVWALSGVIEKGVSRRYVRKTHRHDYSAVQPRLNVGDAANSVSFISDEPAVTATAMHPSMSEPAMGGEAKPQLRRHGDGGGSSADSLTSLSEGPRRDLTALNNLGLLVQHDEARASREAVVEKLFTAVYTALARVDEHLAQTRGEIYIWHFWGRYFFLPGVHWFPVTRRWRVPKKDLEDMATCVRRVARMLWSLLLDFEEGFGSEMEAVLRRYYPRELLSELAKYQAGAIMELLRAFPGGIAIEVDQLFSLGQMTDCLLQISDARARSTVFSVKRKRASVAAGKLGRNRSVAADVTANEAAGTTPATARASGEGRRSSELSTARGQQQPMSGPAVLPAALELEKQPLLAVTALSSSGRISTPPPVAANGGSSGGADTFRRGSMLGSGGDAAGGASGAPRSAAAGGISTMPSTGNPSSTAGRSFSGSGLFISRLMSTTPGEVKALHLPPRWYLQQQQEQQGQQQGHQGLEFTRSESIERVTPAAGNAVLPEQLPPFAVQWRDSADIFGGIQFDALSGAATGGAAAPGNVESEGGDAVASAAASSPRNSRGSRAGNPDASAPAMLPRSNPLPPPPLTSQQQQAPPAGGSGRPVTPFCASGDVPSWMEECSSQLTGSAPPEGATARTPNSPRGDPQAAAPIPAGGDPASILGLGEGSSQPALLSNSPATSPSLDAKPATAGTAAPAAATLSSTAARDSVSGNASVHGNLDTMMSNILTVTVEPVTFPPTEEGYLAQVRWYSFQFLMDEIVNELEEAFHACSTILQKLPYPIGN